MRKQLSVAWWVLAYLIPLLLIVALLTVLVVLTNEDPVSGAPCPVLGMYVVRDQDGVRLQCVKNMTTRNLYWRVVEPERTSE